MSSGSVTSSRQEMKTFPPPSFSATTPRPRFSICRRGGGALRTGTDNNSVSANRTSKGRRKLVMASSKAIGEPAAKPAATASADHTKDTMRTLHGSFVKISGRGGGGIEKGRFHGDGSGRLLPRLLRGRNFGRGRFHPREMNNPIELKSTPV